MGAVQKLATVVIVGLVALATLLVIYLADEPNRMAAESVTQEEVAIERGIQTYIANCVVCHGPAGEGYSEPGAKGTGRIGMPLGGDTELGQAQQKLNQSDDPVTRQERYDLIVKTINDGRGLMPAFGTGAPGGALLNQEQIHELALMIQNVNWNLVYNDVIAADGGYPTFPPAAETPAAAPAQTPAPAAAQTTGGGQAAPAGTEFTVTSHDIFFDPKELTIPANTDVTIHLPNEGVSAHDFSIDALGISVSLPAGETDKSVVINAPQGDYEYYCNVPGHKEAGMFGTLHVVAGGAAPAAGGAAAPAAASPGAEAQQATAPAAAAEFTVTSHDIYFDPKELTIPADTDVTIHLPNEGVTAHDFSIDALGISVSLPAGETDKTVVITAPAGDYEYYCNVPGHKEAGMVGTLHVVAGAAAPAAEGAAPATTAPAEQAASPAAGTAEQAAAPAAAAESVTVTSHDIYFDPKEFTIPANTDVTVHLPNEGVTAHDFSIDALGISVPLPVGETDKAVVINAPPGDYEYYCNVPGHKEAGMVGTMHVVAGAAAPAAEGAATAEATEAPAATPSAPEASPAAEAAQQAPAAAPAAAETVTVTSHDIYFDPKEVTIPANTDVTFDLPNEGVTEHDFSIDALGIAVPLPIGETDKSVVINAPPGDYEYYCNVPGHKEAGMVGTLHVVEGAAAPAAAEGAAPAATAAQQNAAPAEASPATTPAAASPAASVETVTVVSHDIYFDPKEFTIPANTDVTVKLPNEGVTAHDFSIDALGISVPLPVGETDKEVVINAPPGTYEYYCNVPGHKEAGMVGTLIVK